MVKINWKHVWRSLRRRAWLIVKIVVIAAIASISVDTVARWADVDYDIGFIRANPANIMLLVMSVAVMMPVFAYISKNWKRAKK